MGSREMAALLKIVEDGVRILRTRDGVQVTDAQCEERANNIVAALVGNHMVIPWPDEPPADFDWNTSYIAGRPLGHTWSCLRRSCAEYKARVTVEEQVAASKQKERA